MLLYSTDVDILIIQACVNESAER